MASALLFLSDIYRAIFEPCIPIFFPQSLLFTYRAKKSTQPHAYGSGTHSCRRHRRRLRPGVPRRRRRRRHQHQGRAAAAAAASAATTGESQRVGRRQTMRRKSTADASSDTCLPSPRALPPQQHTLSVHAQTPPAPPSLYHLNPYPHSFPFFPAPLYSLPPPSLPPSLQSPVPYPLYIYMGC